MERRVLRLVEGTILLWVSDRREEMDSSKHTPFLG